MLFSGFIFICSRQPYYGWWFYFVVNDAASGELSTISLRGRHWFTVPKNAAEVDALLNASISVKVLAYSAYSAYIAYFKYVLFAGLGKMGKPLRRFHCPALACSRAGPSWPGTSCGLAGCNGLARLPVRPWDCIRSGSPCEFGHSCHL
jgi:hypothetical protein